jgi:3-phenylpropionate/trans-cinnamate dioxygenase ferredoxin subunit
VTWVDVTSATLPDGTLVSVAHGASLAAVARVDAEWRAVDGWCTHQECPLGDGWVEDGALRCACHGALFDLETGAALEGPATEPVAVYATRVNSGRVEVDLP